MAEAGVKRATLGVGLVAGLGLALLAAACSTPRYPTTAPAGPAAPPAQAQQPPRSPVPQQAKGRDQCGAAALQGMVGRSRTEIPIPVNPNLQRVACTTCPVTMDYNEQRLNFFFDAQTGVIKEIRCG